MLQRRVRNEKTVKWLKMETGFKLLFLAGILHLLSFSLGAQPRIFDVCAAAKHFHPDMDKSVVVRGVGALSIEGLLLGSSSCPIARSGPDPIPMIILVDVVSFATPDIKKRFLLLKAERRSGSLVLNLEIRGNLNCRKRLKFVRDGQDIVGADGYGVDGLYKCTLSSAELMMMERSEVQPSSIPRRIPQ